MITEWLEQMSPRERIMVIGCAVFVVLAALWVFGVQPVLKHSAGLEQRVTDKRAQLANLQELAGQVRLGGGSAPAAVQGGNQSLVVIIDRTTREKQLAGYLKRNQPEGPGSVRIRIEGAPFDAVVAWLGDLNNRYGMKATSANFDRAGTGRVNASIVLGRAGG